MAFCFVQGTVGHFSFASTTHTHTVAVKTKMKNSTLAAKTIFYPLAWPSFTLRPPVQSIPAIIVSLSPLRTLRRRTTTTSCALKLDEAFFFLRFYFFFFPSHPLKINSAPYSARTRRRRRRRRSTRIYLL